jgi:hypothetical protein
VPLVDPGVVEHPGQALEKRRLAAERAPADRLGVGLADAAGWNRGRQGE